MVPLKPKVSVSPGLEPANWTSRGIIAKLWPWLVGLSILALLLSWIPRKTLLNAFEEGPWFYIGIYTFLQWLLVLLTDSYATKVSLAITGFKQQFSRIILARGATYILGIFNYALGQGALGVYLQRSGVKALRAAGNIVFLMTVNLGVLLLIASLGFLAGGSPKTAYFNLTPLFLGLWVGMVLYLVVIGLQPRYLQNYQLLAPLWQAGLRGHLRAAAGRFPHMLLLVFAYWGAFRVWGIPVPLAQGVAIVPVVLFINAVPITPLGLGTTQAALVFLLSPYVTLPEPEVQAAVVLAFSLTYSFFGISMQVLLGLWCFQKIRKIK